MKIIDGIGEPIFEVSGQLAGDINNTLSGARGLSPIIAQAVGGSELPVLKLLSSVGTDEIGDVLIRLMNEHGIRTDLVHRDPIRKTTIYQWEATTNDNPDAKRNYIFINRGEAAVRDTFRPGRENVACFLDEINEESIVVTTGIALTRPNDDDCFVRMIATIRAARTKGATTVLNTELRPKYFDGYTMAERISLAENPVEDLDAARKRLAAAFAVMDVVFLSFPDDNNWTKDGHQVFPWYDHEEAKHDLFKSGVKSVIFSNGPDPVRIYEKGKEVVLISPLPIGAGEIVDDGGGSTSLVASAIAALQQGLSLVDGLRIAMMVTDKTMRQEGGLLHWENMPSVDEIRRVLGQDSLFSVSRSL